MKRLICGFLVCVLAVNFFIPVASAAQIDSTKDVIYYEDGSYLTKEILEIGSRAAGSKSGQTAYNYFDSNGTLLWKAILSGTFTYNGTNVSCTASSVSVQISDTAWYEVSKNSDISGNAATGEVTMGRKFVGITIDKVTIDMSLTCDKNGNLS